RIGSKGYHQYKPDDLQYHTADITIRKTHRTHPVPVCRRGNFRKKSVIKYHTADIAHGSDHTAQNTQPEIGAVKKIKERATRRAHITEEFHESFLIAAGIGNGSEHRVKQGDKKISGGQAVIVQGGVNKFPAQKSDHFASKLFFGNRVEINREESGSDHQTVNRICPVVHGPTANYFFGGCLHNRPWFLLMDNSLPDQDQHHRTQNNTIITKQFKSVPLQIG